MGTGVWPWQVYTTNPSVVVESDEFKIVIDDPTIKGSGTHSGALLWKQNPGDELKELCSEVFFTVGVPHSQCLFDEDFPKKIPPTGAIPAIRFLGLAKTEYTLRSTTYGPFKVFRGTRDLAKTTTDNVGQGVFKDIPFHESNGETVSLRISHNKGAGSLSLCEKEIEVSIAAPPINPFLAGPVYPTNIKAEDKVVT